MERPSYWDALHTAHRCVQDWYLEGADAARRLAPILLPEGGAGRAGSGGAGSGDSGSGLNCLHLGCGTSDLGDALVSHLGFASVLNVDFSDAAIAFQVERLAGSAGGGRQQYVVGDATHLDGIADERFDVVVDKGTMDSLLQVRDEEHIAAGCAAVAEMLRVLRGGGVATLISIIPPAIRLPALQECLGGEVTYRSVTARHGAGGAPSTEVAVPATEPAGLVSDAATVDVVVWQVSPFEVPAQASLWVYVLSKLAPIALDDPPTTTT